MKKPLSAFLFLSLVLSADASETAQWSSNYDPCSSVPSYNSTTVAGQTNLARIELSKYVEEQAQIGNYADEERLAEVMKSLDWSEQLALVFRKAITGSKENLQLLVDQLFIELPDDSDRAEKLLELAYYLDMTYERTNVTLSPGKLLGLVSVLAEDSEADSGHHHSAPMPIQKYQILIYAMLDDEARLRRTISKIEGTNPVDDHVRTYGWSKLVHLRPDLDTLTVAETELKKVTNRQQNSCPIVASDAYYYLAETQRAMIDILDDGSALPVILNMLSSVDKARMSTQLLEQPDRWVSAHRLTADLYEYAAENEKYDATKHRYKAIAQRALDLSVSQ